jgi:hypothetical protein
MIERSRHERSRQSSDFSKSWRGPILFYFPRGLLRDLQRVVVGLLDEGLSIETIARLTEFSPEQIQAIGSGQTL